MSTLNIKSSLSQLTELGDIAIDPSTFTINTLTPNGIEQITTSAGVLTTETRRVVPEAVDNRPGVAEKPLALKVSVTDFERLSHNDHTHLVRLIQDANERLRHAIHSDTRCAHCQHLAIKVEEHENLTRATTDHILMTQCGLKKRGMSKVVCPDGRVSGSPDQSLYLDAPIYVPEVTPKADPDKPSTSFDEAW